MSSDQGIEKVVTPILSICIATYNRGRFIGETLDSILGQLTPTVELVIVNGASSDNTAEIMREYLDRYPQIVYVCEKKNSGVDRDYDKAVGYAAGMYCWLMTDDDLLVPGAVSRVCDVLDGTQDLVVVNSEVRNVNFSKVLHPSRLKYSEDRFYDSGDSAELFSEVADGLSFIGGVIIKRELWLERDRYSYYGTLFVHVGVIFQDPPLQKVRVIGDPLILIRYGNAMWSARGFEIWMFKWPKLIWSFSGFSDSAKNNVCPRQPWKSIKTLVLFRGIGGYGMPEFRKYMAGKVNGMLRLLAVFIAISPAWLVNSAASTYCLLFNRSARSGVYDLARSQHSTWLSRYVAKILRV